MRGENITSPRRGQSMAVVAGRIVFVAALWIGILLGIRAALGVLIPPHWCGGTPVDSFVYVFGLAMAMAWAEPHKPVLKPALRKATVLAAGLIVAVLAARLIAGCTPLAVWFSDFRFVVEIFVMLVILIPLAHFHHGVIEPRWARAMGETRDD